MKKFVVIVLVVVLALGGFAFLVKEGKIKRGFLIGTGLQGTEIERMVYNIVDKISYTIEKVQGSPRITVQKFIEALDKDDYQLASTYFTDETKKIIPPERIKELYDFNPEIKYEITGFDQNGKTAFVYFHWSDSIYHRAHVVEEKGEWKIKLIDGDPNYEID